VPGDFGSKRLWKQGEWRSVTDWSKEEADNRLPGNRKENGAMVGRAFQWEGPLQDLGNTDEHHADRTCPHPHRDQESNLQSVPLPQATARNDQRLIRNPRDEPVPLREITGEKPCLKGPEAAGSPSPLTRTLPPLIFHDLPSAKSSPI
jgi:hypothetical protein